MATTINHVKSLKLARAKLVEKRRALAKRDSISDRDEGFANLIVTLQNALDATDRAIAEEEERVEAEEHKTERSEEIPTEILSDGAISPAPPPD